jgi:hypothetical protein
LIKIFSNFDVSILIFDVNSSKPITIPTNVGAQIAIWNGVKIPDKTKIEILMIGEITKNVYSLNKSWSLLVSIEKSRYNANIAKMITIIKTEMRDPYIAMKFSFEVAYSRFTPGIGMKLDKMMIVNRILVTRVHFSLIF